MPILPKPKHELFAQALARGENASKAYISAGFKGSRANACRLKANSNVIARVLELQEAGAKSAEITVASLLDELEHARQRADSLGQLSASVRAISEKARLAGLVVEHSKVEVVVADPYEEASSAEEVLIKVTGDLGIEAAALLAQLFKLPYDKGSIQMLAGNGQQALEWRPSKPNRKRESG